MGLENEYGISSKLNTDPITLSNRIVFAYAKHVYPESNIRWDYDVENPLRDARGFDISRADADPSQLTDEGQAIPNLVLPNGARFYVDHAHPEYAAPEVLNPIDITKWDLAGEQIMKVAVALDAKEFPEDKIRVFKNNVDNKGSSYGTHENYQMNRSTQFSKIVAGLTPHFITRQIFCGAGRIGIGQKSENIGYQISQRADYIEAHVGLETTMKRPIINTRDEPHADPKIRRRLHVIIGDANMSDFANILKVGSTALVISMIEDEFVDFDEVDLLNPVGVVKDISHDLDMKNIYLTNSGKKFSAIDIQEWYLEKSKSYLSQIGYDDNSRQVIDFWEQALMGLRNNKDDLADRVDWIAKLALINRYKEKQNLTLNDDLIQSLDFKYSEITSDDGIAQVLRRKNFLKQYLEASEVDKAISEPPTDTRAWFRGKALSKFSKSIAAASWDSLILDIDKNQPLFRISTTDPLKGTKSLTGEIISQSDTALDLVNSIRVNPGVN
jgi:proteasome accessory factor A